MFWLWCGRRSSIAERGREHREGADRGDLVGYQIFEITGDGVAGRSGDIRLDRVADRRIRIDLPRRARTSRIVAAASHGQEEYPGISDKAKRTVVHVDPTTAVDGFERGDKPRRWGGQRQARGQSSAVTVSHWQTLNYEKGPERVCALRAPDSARPLALRHCFGAISRRSLSLPSIAAVG